MQHQDKVIVVVGASGQQGSAVANALLKQGWEVRLLTRNPNRPLLQPLKDLGAEAYKGDLEDRTSLEKALAGAYGIFSVQTYMGHGVEGEERQGKVLADVAQQMQVQHFIYSSILGADCQAEVPHYRSKCCIEEHIGSLELPATILRPAFFMENFLHTYRPILLQGVWTFSLSLNPEVRLPLCAVEDIGKAVALAFERPEDFIGKALPLAGDSCTMPQVARVFSEVLGTTVRFVELPLEKVRTLSREMSVLFQWLNKGEMTVNIEELRQTIPDLQTLEDWLRRQQWSPANFDTAREVSRATSRSAH
jgi:uncharacterized protein YbjT (DUF2867 family)